MNCASSAAAASCAFLSIALLSSVAYAESSGNSAEFPTLPLPPQIRPLTEQAFLAVDSRVRLPAARATYLPIVVREAKARGLPPAIADAVMSVESAYSPAAIGGVGEIGLMQVRHGTAAMLGFEGSEADLAVPENNIRYGVTYLAQAWRLAGGDLCRALMKYRAGHGEERMSPLSVEYCRRVRLHLAATGYGPDHPALAAPLPEPDFVPSPESAKAPRLVQSRPVSRTAGFIAMQRARIAEARTRLSVKTRARTFWAAHEARMTVLRRKLAATDLTIIAQ
jgi:soluble lytic murein transglycosylase-like protein